MEHFKDYFKNENEVKDYFKDEILGFGFFSEGIITYDTLTPKLIDGDLYNFQVYLVYDSIEFYPKHNSLSEMDNPKIIGVVMVKKNAEFISAFESKINQ